MQKLIIGNWLLEQRKRCGLSVRAVAKKVSEAAPSVRGLTASAISKFERGVRALSAEQLAVLAFVYDADLSELDARCRTALAA